MPSDWKDRKGQFPIHCKFDGVRLDAFLIVRPVEIVVVVLFGVPQAKEFLKVLRVLPAGSTRGCVL